jgi:radical SAM protein with 4Fe4S-binding SPASM domain
MTIAEREFHELRDPPGIRGLDFAPTEIENSRKNDHILMVSPFVSARCNLRCIYCYASSGRALPKELSFKEYEDVILQGKELGARTVWIPGYGEPLMQPRFTEIVELVYSLGMTLVFFTNGTMITERMAKFLFDRDVTVITKCNSFSKEIQDLLAGREGSFPRIQRGLQLLIKQGFNESEPTRLGIESIICRLNYRELPELFQWARRRNIYPYFEMLVHQGRATDAENTARLNLEIREEKSLFEKLLEIDRKEFGYTWVPVPPYVATACNKIFYNVTIDSEGWIKPCCAVDLKIANVRERSLKEIVKTETFRRMRNVEKHLKGNCRNCGIKDCHYGCRSEAHIHGDFFGSYPRCWHNRISPKGST